MSEVGRIVKTYEGDPTIPEHYRGYYHDVVSHTSGMVLRKVVNMDEFYSPIETHKMMLDFDTLPPFMSSGYQARQRYDRYISQGYSPIGGIAMMAGTSVSASIRMSEKGEYWLNQEYLVGPNILNGELYPGVKFFITPKLS
jgi:hypothetical protein